MSPGGENIGGMNVSIDADYSPLAAAYSTAQSMSETAGTDIANALADGAAAGADVGKQIADSLAPITPAADDAAAAIGNFASQAASTVGQDESLAEATIRISGAFPDVTDGAGGAASALDGLAGSAGDAGGAVGGAGDAMPAAAAGAREVASGAQEAEGGLSGMAEQLLAVGEALAITDGMKEFGTAALEASDNVTRASIALTTITGSASKAEEILQGLDALGMQDGLSLPALQTAATRMQQLLGPGADVVSLLSTIANGAASMGSDLNSAASLFTNMAANGMVMSRSIGELGITMQDLANAVNQVNPQLDATSTNLTKVFKTMDQSDRITALQIAFQSLGGVAQQVAEQTFGPQWQQLADAWEQVMIQVGQSLMPVVSGLMDLLKVDVFPFLKELATDFNALPGPIKDAFVAVGLLVAATAPLAAGLAAAGLAVAGLSQLMPAVTAITQALGLAAGDTATAELAQSIASGEAGAAALAEVPELEAATLATGELGAASGQLSLSFAGAEGAAVGYGAEATQLLLPLGEATEAAGGLATGIGSTGLAMMAVGPIIGLAVLSIASLKDGYEQAKETLANVVGTAESVGSSLNALSNTSTAVGNVAGFLKTAWSDVLAVFEKYNTFSLAAQAINAVANAEQALTNSTSTLHSMLPLITADLDKLQQAGTTSKASTDALALSVKQASDAAAASTGGLDALQAGINRVVTAANSQTDAYTKAKAVYDAMNASMQSGTPIMNGQVATAHDVAVAYSGLEQAAGAAGITLTKFQAAIPIGPLKDFIPPLTAAQGGMDLVSASAEAASAKQEQLTLDLGLAQSALEEAAVDYNTANQNGTDYVGALNHLITAQANYDKAATAAGTSQKQWNALVAAAPDPSTMLNNSSGAANGLGAALYPILANLQQWEPTIDPITPAVYSVADAFNEMGIKTTADGDAVHNVIQGFNDLGQASNLTLNAVTTGWEHVSGAVSKLATVDMPQYVQEQQIYLGLLVNEGASQAQIAAQTENVLNAEIKLAGQQGTDATAFIVAQTNMKNAQQALMDQSQLWGNEYNAVMSGIHSGFQTMGNDLANGIVQGESFHDIFMSMLQDIEKEILDQVIGVAFKALGDAITSVIGSLTGVGSAAVSAAGTATTAAGTAVNSITGVASTAASSVTDVASQAGTAMSGAASAAGNAVTSTALSTVSAIASIVSAIGSVIGIIQNIHTDNILGEIEQNTRYDYILNTQTQQNIQWPEFENSGYMVATLDNMLIDSNTELATIQTYLPLLGDVIAWLGIIDADVQDTDSAIRTGGIVATGGGGTGTGSTGTVTGTGTGTGTLPRPGGGSGTGVNPAVANLEYPANLQLAAYESLGGTADQFWALVNAIPSTGGGAGTGSSAPPAVYPPSTSTTSTGGVNVTAHIDLSGSNFGNSNPTTISNAVQAGMTQALVQTLRASGARF